MIELRKMSEFDFMVLGNISKLRLQLISTGIKEGFSSEKTIKISQELDQLIYIYQRNSLNK